MDFYKRAAVVCQSIPYGKVATYGQIALLCGKPNGARQVGFALRRCMHGEAFPTHRVVNAQGYLSGAHAFEKADTQKLLLMQEGVALIDGLRVNLKQHAWRNTMEEALLLLARFEKEGI